MCCCSRLLNPCSRLSITWLASFYGAAIVRAKRFYLTRILNAAQVTLGLLSLVAVGLMAAAGAYNLLAANAFLESAAAFRGGDNITAARLGTRASAVNDTGDNYQGVSV